LPFNYYLSLSSRSLKTPLDLVLAGQPLALYYSISLDRSKPGTKGQTPEQEWPEHAIELQWVELTRPSGPSVGMARHRQRAV